ncbi:MAG: dihydroxyacetone kinase subunit L [Chloroflexaceae bacterium]|nr:dihydroxyacetone kinase subunit L [Chloroflexaceae bacterium]
MQLTATDTLRFLERVAAVIKEHRQELTELDAAIGDADHGTNLDRGFTAVMGKLSSTAEKDIGVILKTTGMTLISTVGGASGPLYGTAFMRAATLLAGFNEVSSTEIVLALEAALEGIKARGKSQEGEKTMIDAVAPGLRVLRAGLDRGEPFLAVMRRAVATTEEGMKATIPMKATKGRASYLGERSIGHQDPGATSAYYILRALLETMEEVAAAS